MENQNQYTDPFLGERTGLAKAALIFGIASLPLAYLTGIFGCVLGIMALLFGIFSKGEARIRSSKAVGGMITGAIGFVFGGAMFAFSMYYVTNHMSELTEMMEGYSSFFNKGL